MKMRQSLAPAGVIAAALLLAGCGGGPNAVQDDDTSAASSPATVSSGATHTATTAPTRTTSASPSAQATNSSKAPDDLSISNAVACQIIGRDLMWQAAGQHQFKTDEQTKDIPLSRASRCAWSYTSPRGQKMEVRTNGMEVDCDSRPLDDGSGETPVKRAQSALNAIGQKRPQISNSAVIVPGASTGGELVNDCWVQVYLQAIMDPPVDTTSLVESVLKRIHDNRDQEAPLYARLGS